MKQDEFFAFKDWNFENIHLKRKIFLINKWCEKGWIDDKGNKTHLGEDFTKWMTFNKPWSLEGHPVEIYWKDRVNPMICIFKLSDNTYDTYYTISLLKESAWAWRNECERRYNTGGLFKFENILFIRPILGIKTIWRHFNYWAWKAYRLPDFFHLKQEGNCINSCPCKQLGAN